jgi:hypothetical protein
LHIGKQSGVPFTSRASGNFQAIALSRLGGRTQACQAESQQTANKLLADENHVAARHMHIRCLRN